MKRKLDALMTAVIEAEMAWAVAERMEAEAGKEERAALDALKEQPMQLEGPASAPPPVAVGGPPPGKGKEGPGNAFAALLGRGD